MSEHSGREESTCNKKLCKGKIPNVEWFSTRIFRHQFKLPDSGAGVICVTLCCSSASAAVGRTWAHMRHRLPLNSFTELSWTDMSVRPSPPSQECLSRLQGPHPPSPHSPVCTWKLPSSICILLVLMSSAFYAKVLTGRHSGEMGRAGP